MNITITLEESNAIKADLIIKEKKLWQIFYGSTNRYPKRHKVSSMQLDNDRLISYH